MHSSFTLVLAATFLGFSSFTSAIPRCPVDVKVVDPKGGCMPPKGCFEPQCLLLNTATVSAGCGVHGCPTTLPVVTRTQACRTTCRTGCETTTTTVCAAKKTGVFTIETIANPQDGVFTVETIANPQEGIFTIETIANPQEGIFTVETIANRQEGIFTVETIANPKPTDAVFTVETIANPQEGIFTIETIANPTPTEQIFTIETAPVVTKRAAACPIAYRDVKPKNCKPIKDCIELQCIEAKTATATMPCNAGCAAALPTITRTTACPTACRAGCATSTTTVLATNCANIYTVETIANPKPTDAVFTVETIANPQEGIFTIETIANPQEGVFTIETIANPTPTVV